MANPIEQTPRRRQRHYLPCFTVGNLAAAAALGFLIGVALASVVGAHRVPYDSETSPDVLQELPDTGT